MGLFVVRAGVKEDMRTEIEKYVVGGISAIGGFGISEFTGEYVVRAAKISEAWQKLLVKSLTRIGFGLLFAGLSWMTGGILSWILFAAAMGSVGGIAMDIIEYLHPGGVKGMAEMLAAGGSEPSEIVITGGTFNEPPMTLNFNEAPKAEGKVEESPVENPRVEVVRVTGTEAPSKTALKTAELYA